MTEYTLYDVQFTRRRMEEVSADAKPAQLYLEGDPSTLPVPRGVRQDLDMGLLKTGDESELVGGWGPDGHFFEVVLANTIHYKCVGRLVNAHSQGSGALIGPNLILTAGHCVMVGGSGGPVYADQYFQPGYPRNRAYRIVRLAVAKPWSASGAYQMDITVGILEEIASPDLWFGVKCNLRADIHHGVYGYPGQAPFDGERCFGDAGGPTNVPWEAPNDWTPSPVRYNLDACTHIDLTPGCSGGPWVGDGMLPGRVAQESNPKGSPGSGRYITGLNSHMYNKYPGIMISPSFGQNIFDFVTGAVRALST